MESLNELVTAMAKGRRLYDTQSRREAKYIIWVDDLPFWPSMFDKLARYASYGYKISLADMSDAIYEHRDCQNKKELVDPEDLSMKMRYFFAGLADAAAEDGDRDMARLAYKISGFGETRHARRHYQKADSIIEERMEEYRARKAIEDANKAREDAAKAKEKAHWDAIFESWKYPRTNEYGETEYHTSYGWFTDEQIENLNKCNYFNQ